MSPLRSAEFFARPHRAWGPRPCPAPSSDCVINAKHINQLSHLDAKKFPVLNFIRFDQALYLFGKKWLVKNFLVETLFVTHKFKYPVYLGASFMKLFLLHMIILIRCRCQDRRISGRGSRTVRLRRMVIGGRGHDVYLGSGPLDGGNTLRPA